MTAADGGAPQLVPDGARQQVDVPTGNLNESSAAVAVVERSELRFRLPMWMPDRDSSAPSRAGPAFLVMCLGVLLVCLAYQAGRNAQPGADVLYWIGQVAIAVPVMVRVLAPRTRTDERVALLLGWAALQSFLAWAYSPDQFRFPDELQHLRTVDDVLRTNGLFTANSYLEVSPGFPGMEIATAALRDLTGLSVFHAGVLVVSICHTVVPVLVFCLVRELVGSPRIAAVAAVVYGTAPHNAYYNTLFVYGAVALPFFLLTIWAALRSRRLDRTALAALPPFLVVVVTHHLTAAMTVVTLVMCTVVFALARVSPGRVVRLLLVSVAAGGVAVSWTAAVANSTFAYLETPVRTVLRALRGGTPNLRSTARTAHEFAAPLWEPLISMAGAGLTLLLVVIGLVALWRSAVPAVVKWFSVLSLAYPLTLAVRVMSPAGGAELATRGLTYVMLFAAIPAAAALTWMWRAGRRKISVAITVATVATMMAGSVTAGLPPWWERVPNGFFIAGYESGIDKPVEAAGQWAARETAPDSRTICDLSVCSVVASYARATVSTAASDPFYASPQELPGVLGDLSLDYLYVDRRMTEQLPVLGIYFYRDVREGEHFVPFDPELLTKFDTTPGVDRVYDNGPIQAYNTRRGWS